MFNYGKSAGQLSILGGGFRDPDFYRVGPDSFSNFGHSEHGGRLQCSDDRIGCRRRTFWYRVRFRLLHAAHGGIPATAISSSLIQAAQLAATIPAAYLTTAGTAEIFVTNGSSFSNQVPFTITLANETISFDAIPNQIFGASPFPITARASSGLPMGFASTTPAVW